MADRKPYHPKRPHRKTRTGCRACKARRVKCDEGRPACRACTARQESCVYAIRPTAAPSSAVSSLGAGSDPSSPGAVALRARRPHAASVTQQPLFVAPGRDEIDMRLLWFYTTATYASFSTGGMRERSVDVVLKVNVVQHAFANPFLMNCVLGLSAMHMNQLGIRNMGVSRAHEIRYRANAVETYRKAVAAADPVTYPALLVCSLLLCALSTHVFRGDDAQPFAILDWMALWKGIGTIIDITRQPRVFRSGVAALLFRPPIDLDASARCVPAYLLFMVASIKPGDPDFDLVQRYYEALQFLGSLYLELRNGFSHMLVLRVVTLPTFLPKQVIDAAREKRPRALIILAHYLVFLKFRVMSCWWMDGISEHELPNVARCIGPDWADVMRVPLAAMCISSNRDLVRLLLDDPDWDQPTTLQLEPLTSTCERELAIRAVMQEDAIARDAGEDKTKNVQVWPC
ncbi:hypothetical protein C8A05DRAFT_14675 [Staphylotrichum tortipilum]|uniref:Zn(2)-C6 fungal-type domain-containing protein n=1 Tax=Staphylotrichum tortipilum TaxID=2831512 RepID=A0AAN6MN47_9PEZI|nr:hypothetical protein C8A05DRAFT_14675 [Staphylotrichum longicolle]